MRRKRWLVWQRQVSPKPRGKRLRSVAKRRNERWAMDGSDIPVGQDGWSRLTAVIDCYDRELVGCAWVLRGRAKEAERALEAACRHRCGTIRANGATPIIRRASGLIYQSRRFRAACAFYRLDQDHSTPYTPEQNGLIERSFRSLKEEWVGPHPCTSFAEGRRVVNGWITWYNAARPRQALGYWRPSPYQHPHQQQAA